MAPVRQNNLVKTLCLLAVAFLSVRSAVARENPYDLLGRCLTPFVNLVAEHAKEPSRALSLAIHLEQMTGLPEEYAGAHADLAVEYPDKLRLHGPVQGEELTICRHGQEIWVSPGSKASALLQKLETEHRLPALDPKFQLAPFQIPVPEKDLVFLPALFEVHDAGDEAVNGVTCRVLEVKLNPALQRSLKSAAWSGRLWVGADARPVRLVLRQTQTQAPPWTATLSFDTVSFQKSLPPETWQPSAEQVTDTAKISAPRYDQILRSIVSGK